MAMPETSRMAQTVFDWVEGRPALKQETDDINQDATRFVSRLAPRAGLEPATSRLTAGCSTN
jgi:hypothetical protein